MIPLQKYGSRPWFYLICNVFSDIQWLRCKTNISDCTSSIFYENSTFSIHIPQDQIQMLREPLKIYLSVLPPGFDINWLFLCQNFIFKYDKIFIKKLSCITTTNSIFSANDIINICMLYCAFPPIYSKNCLFCNGIYCKNHNIPTYIFYICRFFRWEIMITYSWWSSYTNPIIMVKNKTTYWIFSRYQVIK